MDDTYGMHARNSASYFSSKYLCKKCFQTYNVNEINNICYTVQKESSDDSSSDDDDNDGSETSSTSSQYNDAAFERALYEHHNSSND